MSFFVKHRKVIGVTCTGLGSISIFSAYILPQTYFMEDLKEVTQAYSYGEPIPVSESTMKIVQRVQQDMKLNSNQVDMLKVFTGYGFDVFGYGCLYLPTSNVTSCGACMGLPTSFNAVTAEDLNTSNIQVDKKSVNWESREGAALKDSLILSESGKKFAIAQKLNELHSYKPFALAIAAGWLVAIGGRICTAFNIKRDLYTKPKMYRFLMYGFVWGLQLLCFIAFKDYYTCHVEHNANKIAASISLEYAYGGLEYYNKILQRNIAMQLILGNSHSLYTAYGNDNVFIRRKHIPITERRDQILQIIEELKHQEKDNTSL